MNKVTSPIHTTLLLGLALLASEAGAAEEAAYPVAGLTPWQRPAGAPVLRNEGLSPEAMAAALRGVSRPIPETLAFLKDQGGWFNPFTRPGMTGYYDIRGWHKAGGEKR